MRPTTSAERDGGVISPPLEKQNLRGNPICARLFPHIPPPTQPRILINKRSTGALRKGGLIVSSARARLAPLRAEISRASLINVRCD